MTQCTTKSLSVLALQYAYVEEGCLMDRSLYLLAFWLLVSISTGVGLGNRLVRRSQ